MITSSTDLSHIASTPLQTGTFLALAPMDGVTDFVYREWLTSLFAANSGISMCVTEFVRVVALPVPAAVFLRDCPELRNTSQTKARVPVFVQLLGSHPEAMAQSAVTAVRLGAAGIDLNFGCPAKTVNNHDGGACLLKTPHRVESVTHAVRTAVPLGIPVTVKIRTGWDNADCVEVLARAAQNGGASWLTIHGRTRAQLYAPPADWHAIGRARRAIAIPVVANGDLFDRASLQACAAQSGCSAFMLGRGAMARPDLFALIRDPDRGEVPFRELCTMARDYGDRLQAAADRPGRTLGRLKQLFRFATLARSDGHEFFERFKALATLADAYDLMARP